jgi:hypothetical protein
LANCGNLYFPDLNFTDFGEKTQNFTNFGLKKQVLAMFDTLFVRKIIFHPNLTGDSPGKIISGKIFLPPPPARQHFWGK